jgi:hypothetical protein
MSVLHFALFTCFCLTVHYGEAQGFRGGRIDLQLGVKANLQNAGIANQNNYGQNEMDYGLNAGIGGGAVLTWSMDPQKALQLEVSYQSGGQEYDDTFKGHHFRKEVRYHLISFPLMYRHTLSDGSAGYSGVRVFSKPVWYVLGGLQINRILSPEIDWHLDGSPTDFLSFVLEGGNPNQEQLEQLGMPVSDSDFFVQWDAMLVGAGGCQLYFAPSMYLSAELRGGIGLTDINAKPWRLNNNDGIYGASRNVFLGVHAGVHVHLAQR